ncbi:MAG TPA: DUF4331 domain-containing protein [Polyangiales bacterium]|nr:DUF4331 domain-containing protein [Polyangiales bacterium]
MFKPRLTIPALMALLAPSGALASSHREAPFITKNPKADATDFYIFKSYEPGRQDYVTIIANYQPFQEPYGGPNFFNMDPEAIYELNVDNDGDAKEDLTFRFRFDTQLKDLAVDAGGKKTSVPLVNIGPVSVNDASNQNVTESYTVQVRRPGKNEDVTNWKDGSKVFAKPLDYVGTKSLGAPEQYEAYAKAHVHDIKIPGCEAQGRVFVGQRKESFAVNLGVTFDLVNAPASIVAGGTTREARSLAPSSLDENNVTSIALELPVACLKGGKGDIVGAWTAASVRQVRIVNPRSTYELPSFEGGAWTQISRLSNPLVNELVIGLKDKDLFNNSKPKDDAQFADYVTNPSLPELLEVLFGSAGVVAPNVFPRADLVAAFLTGVPDVNANGSTAEMQRLNTALPATEKGKQNSLGAAACFVEGVLKLDNAGCDPAGFPNGRRPGDDVVDIALRVSMGYLLPKASAPSGQIAFTDATLQEDSQFDAVFPYLTTPLPGAP